MGILVGNHGQFRRSGRMSSSIKAASRIRKRDIFKRLYARHVHPVIEWIEPLAFIAAWVLSAAGLLYYKAYTSPWAWLVAIVASLPVSEVIMTMVSVAMATGWIRFTGSGQQ